MRWFENLSTTVKISLLSTVLIVALGYASYEAYVGFQSWSDYSLEQRDNRLPTINALGNLNTERMAIRAQTVEVFAQYDAVTDKRRLREIQAEREASWETVDRYWAELTAIPRSEDGQRLLDAVAQDYRAWRAIYVDLDRIIAELIDVRNTQGFERLMAEYQATVGRMIPISNSMGGAFVALTEHSMNQARGTADNNVAQAHRNTVQMSWFSAIALIVAVSLATLTLLALVRPLRTLVQSFAEIGGGNYDVEIDCGRKDEIGVALQALDKMQSKLKADIAETKRVAAENLRIRYGLDNVSASVMIADSAHNIIYVNGSGQKLFRRRGNEIRRDLPRFDAEKLQGANVDVFHKSPPHQRQILDNLRAPHSTQIELGGLTLALVVSPIFDEDGERLG